MHIRVSEVSTIPIPSLSPSLAQSREFHTIVGPLPHLKDAQIDVYISPAWRFFEGGGLMRGLSGHSAECLEVF